MPTIAINYLDLDDPTALYCQYPRQHQPQPCYVELDCDHNTIGADYSGEIGGSVPARVWHNRVLRWSIPALTASAANNLLDEIAPLCERLLVGYSCDWDGSNHVGRLTDAARDIEQQVEALLYAHDWSDDDLVQVWSAGDWLVDEPEEVTATSTDEDLAALASTLAAEALIDGIHEIEGLAEYLGELRDRLRDEAAEAAEVDDDDE